MKDYYREHSDLELAFETIWSWIRDIIIVSLTLGIILGAYLLLTSSKVFATELKTTLTSRLDIEEVLQKNNGIDPLDKLSLAVAMHETHNCQDKTNFTAVNNCHGIRKLRDGKLQPARYSSIEESHKDFKDIWIRKYGGRVKPTIKDAERYSGGDNASAWYINVNHILNTI